jgi:PEP-CTERM motif
MTIRGTIAAVAIAFAMMGANAASAASTLNIQYFDIANSGSNVSNSVHTDFGICCSTGDGASFEGNLTGTSLLGGLPVVGTGSTVWDVNGLGQILWWTPGTMDQGYTIIATGSGIVPVPISSTMYAPNSTGVNNNSLFETAILYGNLIGDGSNATISITSDDDALVYVNGQYVGGNPGVHSSQTTNIDLGILNGTNSLAIFYADRAHVEANLALTIRGAVTSAVPEPATWAMFIIGFGSIGLMMRGSRRKSVVAAV